MNTQQNIRYLHKKVNDIGKDMYCLKQYVQDHSGGGGEDFNGISTTTSGNINFSGNGTASDPLSANISLKTLNGENIVGSGNISLPTYSNGTGLNLTGNQFSVIYGTTANTSVQGNDSRLHTHSNKAVIDGVTTTLVNNWNSAYSWGDHSLAGYLTNIKTINGQTLVGTGDITITAGGSYTNGVGLNLAGTEFSVNFGTSANTVAQGNDSRFHTHSNKTSLDSINDLLIGNWSTAFSWGNHASEGYLKEIKTINSQTLVGMGDIVLREFPLTAENKLTSIEEGAQVNPIFKTINSESIIGSGDIVTGGLIDEIKVDGNPLTITGKSVDIVGKMDTPTVVGDLEYVVGFDSSNTEKKAEVKELTGNWSPTTAPTQIELNTDFPDALFVFGVNLTPPSFFIKTTGGWKSVELNDVL